jgi:hypothetical protein
VDCQRENAATFQASWTRRVIVGNRIVYHCANTSARLTAICTYRRPIVALPAAAQLVASSGTCWPAPSASCWFDGCKVSKAWA